MTLSKFLDPKNDVAFKKVFGSEKHKDILIHFINDILELKGNDQIEGVEFLSPVQDAEIASKKQSIVDVLCRDKNGVQIIVEMVRPEGSMMHCSSGKEFIEYTKKRILSLIEPAVLSVEPTDQCKQGN